MPPLVGTGVNNLVVPGQTGPAGLEEISTLGVRLGLTTMEIPFDDTVAGDTQAAVEVIRQLTTSPFDSEVFVYRALFEPTILPFSNH